MEIKKTHWFVVVISLIIISISVFIFSGSFSIFLLGIGIMTGVSPFIYSLIMESVISAEKEEMFLEFARNLVESVKTGTPISKSIVNVKDKPYGYLTENIQKLANQISMGIPLSSALQTFSRDVNNPTVTRAITLIGQAEKAGGDISQILEAVANAVTLSDKLKKERKAAISTLVVQGYIIFIIFMIIILVMQFQILPMVSGIAETGTLGSIGVGATGEQVGLAEVSTSFLYLLLIQGFFSGLAIGKLAENDIKAGLKHSFALVLISLLVSTGANVLFG
jgi:pilus assembly protein TadC